MLLRFLNERVIDKKFNNATELTTVLQGWKDFAELNELGLDQYWKNLSFDETSKCVFFPTESGEKFIVALIKDFTETSSPLASP